MIVSDTSQAPAFLRWTFTGAWPSIAEFGVTVMSPTAVAFATALLTKKHFAAW